MINMRAKTITYISATWMAAVMACHAAPPDAVALLSEIERDGAAEVLRRLSAKQSTFESVCGRIESGDARWLEIARRLRSVSDGGLSLSLNYSVARAIPRAPERVLALVGNGFSVQDVCTSPYIEPDPGAAEKYQRRAVAALGRVANENLARVKTICLAEINRPLREK